MADIQLPDMGAMMADVNHRLGVLEALPGGLTQTKADTLYLGKTAKAESAKTADTAKAVAWTGVTGRPTKVSQFTNDSGYLKTQVQADWNATSGVGVIKNKPTMPTKMSQLTNDSGFVTTAVTNGLIPKSGERGTLTGHETAATLTGSPTININSASTNVLNTSGKVTLTFTAAAATASDVKVIALTATAATTLTITGAAWANGGSAPTWGTVGKHLVLVANFLGGRVVLNVFDNDEG